MNIEQYLFDKISNDTTLATLLDAGGGKIHLYPNVIPRGLTGDTMMTFTKITTTDRYPTIESVNVQFNIFAKTHLALNTVSSALSNLFNEDNLQQNAGLVVIFSIRKSESDLGYNYDDKYYQREATYYFKIK